VPHKEDTMAKLQTPKPAPTTAPVPKTDPLVGIVMIKRSHTSFGASTGASIQEQSQGIYGGIYNAEKTQVDCSQVGRLVVLNERKNIIAVYKVKAWVHPSPELFPHRAGRPELLKKKGICCILEEVPASIVGRNLALDTSKGLGFNIINSRAIVMRLSEVMSLIGAAAPEPVEKVVGGFTPTPVVEEEYAM